MNAYENIGEPIYIVTSPEAKPAPIGDNWFYQFVGGDGRKDSGYLGLCDCRECGNLGEELGEFYAIYRALKWASEVQPNGKFELCYGSANFGKRYEKDGAFQNESHCRFFRDLVEGVGHLMRLLNVELTHYTYANKDGIPILFLK